MLAKVHLGLGQILPGSSREVGHRFGKIGFPNINILACKSADNLPRTRKDVMQQIYGSNWSIAHSTINFGIPEGLGQRVDEDEVPPLPGK